MRAVARFAWLRATVAWVLAKRHRHDVGRFVADCEARLDESFFQGVDREKFIRDLERDGVAYGLRLPAEVMSEISAWAEGTRCYVDRDTSLGFLKSEHAEVQQILGKPVLLAQYFNTTTECSAVKKLVNDPLLQWIACRYLSSLPTFVGANLWWTFPVDALESDRNRHANLFHRDLDDFRFFKFFFYLTDVEKGEGAHVCVISSHRDCPKLKLGDQWNIRRYDDEEIESVYPENRIHEICGDAGVGFAENTLCIHKGLTPKTRPRLLLQLQFALFDYGAMHDKRDPAAFRSIS